MERGNTLAWLGKGLLAVLDQGLISGSNFMVAILLARWLIPEQYGAYALAFSIFLFVSGFHNALLLEPMSVFGRASYDKQLPAYFGKMVRLHFLVAAFLTLLLGAGIALFYHLTTNRVITAALLGCCISIPLILLFWLCRRGAYLQLSSHLAAVGASVYCVLLIGFLFLIKTLHWLSTFTAFLIQSLAAGATGVLLLVFLRPKFGSASGPASSAIARQHWRYGRWVVATAFVCWLSGNAYYLIVGAFLRMEDVAALRALQNFALPLMQFLTAVSLLVLPWAAARLVSEPENFQRRIHQVTLLLVGAACLYLGSVWAFGDRLIGMLYGGKYTEFGYLLIFIAAPVVLTAASQGNTIALQAMQLPSDIFLAYAIAGVATVVPGIPLTRHWGLRGVAAGLVVSSAAYSLTIFCRYRARTRVRFVNSASQSESGVHEARVAWIIPSMRGGHYWQPLLREFAKLFPETRIFTSEWPGYMAGYEERFAVRVLPGLKYFSFKQSPTGVALGYTWVPPSILWELFQFRPGVLFTSAFTLWTLYALIYKAFTGSRVVLLLDGISDTIACMNSPVRLRIRRLLARFVDVSICNSGEGIEYLRTVVNIPQPKLLQCAFYVPETDALLGDKVPTASMANCHPTFLFVAQVIKRKGWRYLLEASSLLVKRGLGTFSLVVVGEGAERGLLESSVASMGLQQVVNVVGAVPYRRLGTFFENSDVFVLPTLEDTWGVVVSEAMAFGKPVLCSKYAGAKELVLDGINGFVFDPYNAAELADCMERFIRQPELITRFGQKSREIITPYTPENAAKTLGARIEKLFDATVA